jgi:hypothetical protein
MLVDKQEVRMKVVKVEVKLEEVKFLPAKVVVKLEEVKFLPAKVVVKLEEVKMMKAIHLKVGVKLREVIMNLTMMDQFESF